MTDPWEEEPEKPRQTYDSIIDRFLSDMAAVASPLPEYLEALALVADKVARTRRTVGGSLRLEKP